MELLFRGKVNLYTRTVLKTSSSFAVVPITPSTITYYDDFQYYLKRDNEESATLIACPNRIGSCISKARTGKPSNASKFYRDTYAK